MSPAKVPTTEQCEWLHQKFSPPDCCICNLKAELAAERALRVKAEAALEDMRLHADGMHNEAVYAMERADKAEAALAAAVKERDAWRRGDDENADGKHACPEDAFDEARRLRAEAEGRDA